MPDARRSHLAYRVLAGATAALCFLFGLLFIVAFLDRALFPVFARPLFDTNYWGYYVLAFAGSTLIAWGGCLIAAVRDPRRTIGIATASAGALIVGGVLRLLAWYSGEYRGAAEQLRFEAAVLVVLALGFVWLRPPRDDGA